MKNFRVLWVLVLVLTCISAPAETVRIATWNIEHLRAQNQVGAVKRDDQDFAKLASLAQSLDADIIALQEVDGEAAARRVFDDGVYNFHFSDRNDRQRTGFAVRKTINVTSDLDYTDLSIGDSVRRGTDITVEIDGQALRLLSVHLKSGCFDRPLTTNSNACNKLEQQLPILERWIDERTIDGIPFIVFRGF